MALNGLRAGLKVVVKTIPSDRRPHCILTRSAGSSRSFMRFRKSIERLGPGGGCSLQLVNQAAGGVASGQNGV